MGKLQKDEAFYKKLWSLMVPIVLQNLMLAMVAVADAFMLGGMDQNYMSAVSLATQIQFIQNMFLAAAINTNVALGYNFVAMQHLLPPMQHLYLHKGSVYQ